jgi:hypothetical protein
MWIDGSLLYTFPFKDLTKQLAASIEIKGWSSSSV